MTDSSRQSSHRSSAKKTALLLAVIAFAIYGAFILSGVIGR